MAKNADAIQNILQQLASENVYYPVDDAEIGQYAYLNSIWHYNPLLAEKVASKLGTAVDTLTLASVDISNLEELAQIAKIEKQKERSFLSFAFPDKDYSAEDSAQMMIAFNKLYQSQAVFERNAKIISQVAETNQRARVDITASFESYLDSALNYAIGNKLEQYGKFITEEDLRKVLDEAIRKMFQADSSDTTKSAYQELYNAFSNDANSGARRDLLDKLFQLYFGVNTTELLDDLRHRLTQARRKKEKISYKLKGSRTKHGNVMEYVEQFFLTTMPNSNTPKGKVSSTGSSGMKADTIIDYTFKMDLSQYINQEESNSTRVANINKMTEFAQIFKQSNHYLVEISDKSYTLGTGNKEQGSKYSSAFNGFSAESHVTLNNLQEILTRVSKSKYLKELIFLFLNSGPRMFYPDYEKSTIGCNYLATLVAYFMFDDITESVVEDAEQAANIIHLYNLDGIYLPFSTILESIYAGLKSAEKANKQVSVSFHSRSEDYEPQSDGLQLADWQAFRDARMKDSFVSFHFMQGFAQFFDSLLKGVNKF